MADHVFNWPQAHVYLEARDLAGVRIGLVNPGDIRDTDGPLDRKWLEATDDHKAAARTQTVTAAADAAEDNGDKTRPRRKRDTPAAASTPGT
jgi:hypothetical protein